MERFFDTLKLELGPLARCKDIGELYEVVAFAIYYYNTRRIHTSLGMSPAAYAARLTEQALLVLTSQRLEIGCSGERELDSELQNTQTQDRLTDDHLIHYHITEALREDRPIDHATARCIAAQRTSFGTVRPGFERSRGRRPQW